LFLRLRRVHVEAFGQGGQRVLQVGVERVAPLGVEDQDAFPLQVRQFLAKRADAVRALLGLAFASRFVLELAVHHQTSPFVPVMSIQTPGLTLMHWQRPAGDVLRIQ
jgi:hypothetical protein